MAVSLSYSVYIPYILNTVSFLVCFSLFVFTQTLKHNLEFFPNYTFPFHIVRDPQSLPHFIT